MKCLATILFLVAFVHRGFSGTSQKPEELGAHGARVSDVAEVELLADWLKGVAEGKRAVEIVRKHIAPEFEMRDVVTPTNGDTAPPAERSAGSVVNIEGDLAVVSLGQNGSMSFRKSGSSWILTGASGFSPSAGGSGSSLTESYSVGNTFTATPISNQYGIDRLNRATTVSRLNRKLMSATGNTASYYHVRYLNSAPFVRATYIQFLVDREWNRILYGNLDNWVKAYANVEGPVSVATDPLGRLFVSESANQRIQVLSVIGEEADAQLVPLYNIGGLEEPGDIASNDGGTPFDAGDDLLYVIDAGRNQIIKYAPGSYAAVEAGRFDGFEGASSIEAGRWNGVNNNLLYVIDQTGRRLRLFEDIGTSLSLVRQLEAGPKEYFQDITTDHFGNVYLTENINARILKYTPDLYFLDAEGGQDLFSSPGALDIPFGTIEIEGKEIYRAGFDQLFAAEQWSETSGAQRRMLGLALKNIRLAADGDLDAITSSFTMTDFGSAMIQILDAADTPVRSVHSGWLTSGDKSISWDRRDNAGKQVPPGTYRYKIEALSPYREESTSSLIQFYLPLRYWQDCGSEVAIDDGMLVQGSAVSWGNGPSETANEHPTSVVYHFTGLNPESEYQVAAEYVSHDGIPRLQSLTADAALVHEGVAVTGDAHYTGFISIPKETYSDGEISITIKRLGEGTAIVSQLWLKETGIDFSAKPVDGTLPTEYALEQNYPNPFNPTTVIRYAIPFDGNVKLKIYDITGREVATLVNEQKAAGTYQVRFDSYSIRGGLASGVYFYRVQSGIFSETRKMMLLK